MGTPDFAVPSLDALVDDGLAPIAVVTVPDKPAGRGRKLRIALAEQLAAGTFQQVFLAKARGIVCHR